MAGNPFAAVLKSSCQKQEPTQIDVSVNMVLKKYNTFSILCPDKTEGFDKVGFRQAQSSVLQTAAGINLFYNFEKKCYIIK